MRIKYSKITLIAGLTLLAVSNYAGAPMPAAAGDMASEVAPDPKKKKAGEECKASDECQNHHTCSKVGEKNVCKAPPPHKLPPGVVT